jgi:hypothetical protein
MNQNGYPAFAEAPIQTQEFSHAFQSAQRKLLPMTQDEYFHADLKSKGLDPYDDMCTEGYWDTFAAMATTAADNYPEDFESQLEQDAFKLLANTPQFLYKQYNLRNGEGRRDRNEVAIASSFNAMIRTFADQHPDAPVSAVQKGMLEMIDASVEEPAIASYSAKLIDSAIRGARHELAVGQILQYTNRWFRPANLHEDLAGNDFIVASKDGQTAFGIDVKASTQKTDGKPFVWRGPNNLVMFSHLAERDFPDRFFLRDATAAGKGEGFNILLANAEKVQPKPKSKHR